LALLALTTPVPFWLSPRTPVSLLARPATPHCSLLKAGQRKAVERGQVVTRIVCVSMTEATERRRKACG
jgi:hypothetical protein